MGRDHARAQIVELFQGVPGWRLEARSTPGASPLWCYVSDGEVLFSVTAEKNLLRLYVMATDEDLVFESVDQLTAWLRTHRSDALEPRTVHAGGKPRIRKFFEWS